MIVAHNSHPGVVWTIFHCEWVRRLYDVTLVDDEALIWRHFAPDSSATRKWARATGEWPECEHKAKRILINPKAGLILIDPVPDLDSETDATDTQQPTKEKQPS